MKQIRTLIVVALIVLGVQTVQAQEYANESKASNSIVANHVSTPIHIIKASEKIVIDGLPNDKDWKKASSYPLSYFYKTIKPTDKQASKVKMLWDDNHLYFYFQAEDQYLTTRETERDGAPYNDDCFEVFLIPSATPIKLHYGFEINLNKAKNDFIWLNDFYQNSNVSLKSYSPSYEVGTQTEGSLNDNSDIDVGWSMEVAIPIKAFHSPQFTPVKLGTVWNILIIRQDRNDPTGDRRSTSTLFPLTEDRGVHDPMVFGQIKFVSN